MEKIRMDKMRIINELEKNGRRSMDQIAENCGFSRQKVWRIINALEKNKTIWGYTAIVNDDKINRKKFVILIKKSTDPIKKTLDKTIQLTMQNKAKKIGINIGYSMYLHGDYDWLFIFSAQDLVHAKRFSDILMTEYPDSIREVKLLEGIFQVQKAGIINPDLDELKDIL
jgi:DNA-binding Lrp family transcriptional regulator